MKFPSLSNQGFVVPIFKWLAEQTFGGILDRKSDWDRRMEFARQGRLSPEDEEFNKMGNAKAVQRGEFSAEEFERIYGMTAEQALRTLDPTLLEKSLEGLHSSDRKRLRAKYADTIRSANSFTGGMKGFSDRYDDFYSKWKDYDRKIARQSREDRRYWEKQRDKAEGAYDRGFRDFEDFRGRSLTAYDAALAGWRRDRGEAKSAYQQALAGWRDVFQDESAVLSDIRDQQLNLATELRDAPSTVEEQARIQADKALQQSVAMAGAFGGSLSTDFGALQTQAGRQAGDVLRDTSALRSAEYSQRLGQQADLLGEAGGTTLDLANLGISNLNAGTNYAGFLRDLGLSDLSAGTQYAGYLGNLGLSSFGVGQDRAGFYSDLGARNFDVGTSILNRQGTALSTLGSVLGRQNLLEQQAYNRFITERDYRDRKEREERQRRDAGMQTFIKTGVPREIASYLKRNISPLGGRNTQQSFIPKFSKQPFEMRDYASGFGR